MLRIPVKRRIHPHSSWIRSKSSSSSSFIRSTFIDYFVSQHGHKHVKSSPVVPLFDPTVPFVNAGMNQKLGEHPQDILNTLPPLPEEEEVELTPE